jgi:glycosyltransferase involved in cell wall biosynthesis
MVFQPSPPRRLFYWVKQEANSNKRRQKQVKVAILTSFFFHEVEEIQGRDRIIWGGGERYLYELCKLIQAQGHQVAVFQSLPQTLVDAQGHPCRVDSGNINKEFDGIPFICLPNTDNMWAFHANPQLNSRFNENAIYYDLSIYFITSLAWPYAVNPSISISHGIIWDYPYHDINNNKIDDQEEFRRRQLYGFTGPDVCVSVDSNVRKVMSAFSPGSERNIRIIYNFVDTEKFKPAPKTWDGIRVLYPRRLTMLRGCNEFIKASRELPQYEYTAVGQAADERLEKVMVLWGETTPNLRFIHKPMEGMEEVYQESDISIVPTKACEGLSLSLLESMSCGLPVITTPVGGLGDAVIDGYNALLFDPNHDNLADFIAYLAKHERLRRKFGKRNREIAKSFDIKLWREKWKKLIKSFVG